MHLYKLGTNWKLFCFRNLVPPVVESVVYIYNTQNKGVFSRRNTAIAYNVFLRDKNDDDSEVQSKPTSEFADPLPQTFQSVHPEAFCHPLHIYLVLFNPVSSLHFPYACINTTNIFQDTERI
jgi:hypothetical protein